MSPYLKGGIAAVLAVIGVFLWYSANVSKLPVNQSPAGFKVIDKMETDGVPDFTLNRMDGSPLKLSDLKGKLVIVNFWASWCNPCVEEFPSMMKLIDQFKGEIVIVAVTSEDQKSDIEAFMKAFALPKPNFEVVWDQDKSVMQKFGVEKVPESFIVGRDMKLLRKVTGVEDWSSRDAVEFFKELLAPASKPAPATGS